MPQGNQFDNDSARRIARTVLRDERRNQGTTGQGRGATPQILPPVVIGFTLTEDMGETTPGEASATLHKTWVPADEGYSGSDAGVVVDPGDIFELAVSGAYGKGLLRTGNDRQVVDPYNMSCP